MAVMQDSKPLYNTELPKLEVGFEQTLDHKKRVFENATYNDFVDTALHHYPKVIIEDAYPHTRPNNVFRASNAKGERVGIFTASVNSFILRVPRAQNAAQVLSERC